MGDMADRGSEVTWWVAVQVWWALTWRVTALGAIVGTSDSVLLGKVLSPETNDIIFISTSIPAMVWSVWKCLKVKYRSFTITINRK